MSIQLVSSSAVVAAQHFNPTITGQHWLIEHGILMPEERQVGAVFTDMFVQVPTRDFNLQVMQDNCQISFPADTSTVRQRELLTERLGRIINLLPHTPYTGVGLNFVWHVYPDNETVGDLCRRLFYSKEGQLCQEFDKGDARFGMYMSMDWNGYRLRLDAKPVVLAFPDAPPSELLQLAFNYHKQVVARPEPWKIILGTLDQWQQAHENAMSIATKALGEKMK
jgi:hypothetical protein